jgi:predicted transcriptional regulator
MGQRRNTEANDVIQDGGDEVRPPWSDDETPIHWLFATRSRAELVLYAVENADNTDIPYFNKSELADEVGISRDVVHKYIEDLVAVGIYETRGGHGTFVKYRPNTSSSVVAGLYEAGETMQSLG